MSLVEIFWLGVTIIAIVALTPFALAIVAGFATWEQEDERAIFIMGEWFDRGIWIGPLAGFGALIATLLLH